MIFYIIANTQGVINRLIEFRIKSKTTSYGTQTDLKILHIQKQFVYYCDCIKSVK